MTTAVAESPALGYLDLYPYGHRDVLHYDADGKFVGSDMVPLTLEQVLHPEETDHPVSSARHDFEVRYLADACQALAPDALVTSDVPHYWGVENLGHHRPDVAVTFGVADLRSLRPKFECADEGTRPVLLIEVVSPSTRDTDVADEKKVDHYRRAGIAWYVIVDRVEDEDEPKLVGRHLEDGAWVGMEPDANGRLFLPPVNAWLRVVDGELRVTDARTGLDVEIGDTAPLRVELDAERQGREAERQGREVAERRAAEAERQAHAERQARADLERRLAELEARLRAADPTP